MLNRLSIKSRILILALLPSSLLALALAGYFSWMQMTELRHQMVGHGELILENIAPVLAPALVNHEDQRLQRTLSNMLDAPDVRSVTLLNAKRQPILHAGPRMLTPPPLPDPQAPTSVSDLDSTHLLMPLLSRHITLEPSNNGSSPAIVGWVELELTHHPSIVKSYRNLLPAGLLILAAFIISFLFSNIASRRINEPIQLMLAVLTRLSEGRLGVRVPRLPDRELSRLGEGINRMAEALQRNADDIQQDIDQVTHDALHNLELIEVQNIELDIARREAIEASRVKSEFLASMSHELRTPLNGIIGFSRLLRKAPLSTSQQSYLDTIEHSADHLLSMLSSVLDFSKIEAGKLTFDSHPFDLRDIVEESVSMQALAGQAKQLEMVSLIDPDVPLSLIGDELRIKQILTNFIGNAIKFTESGSICVRAHLLDECEESAQIRVTVTDTGIGLSKNDTNAIFEPFSQLNPVQADPGYGLGLVICKRIIEGMGGEIGVESDLGKGSMFWFSLNIKKAVDTPEPQLVRAWQGLNVGFHEPRSLSRLALVQRLEELGFNVEHFDSANALADAVIQRKNGAAALQLAFFPNRANANPESRMQWLESLRPATQQQCAVALTSPIPEFKDYQQSIAQQNLPIELISKPISMIGLRRALQNMLNKAPTEQVLDTPQEGAGTIQVLCVDDNATNLLLIKTLLDDMGAEVITADSGEQALALYAEHNFDLVFMDMRMPDMDGMQTTEAIRQWEQQHQLAATPIVALTANALSEERTEALRRGLDDYITKPISVQQLYQATLKWTHRKLPGYIGGTDTEHASPKQPSPVPFYDAEDGIRLAAGRPDLAKQMFSMLLESLPTDIEVIKKALSNFDREAMLERVHRLHGATKYAGVPHLRLHCETSERLLKHHHPDAFNSCKALLEAIYALQEFAQKMA